MKRILILLACLLIATTAFSQERRIVEFGADVKAGVSNNYFTVFDFFNNEEDKTLVIDFNELANQFATSDFVLSGDVGVKSYFNLNLSKDLKMGVFVATDVWAYTGLPGGIFSLIANGNELDRTYTESLSIQGNAFASAGAHLYMRTGNLGIRFAPSYFMPLAVVRDASAVMSFTTGSDGTIAASADVAIPIYSTVPIEEIEGLSTDSLVNTILGNGGLDFTLSADYQLTKEWLLGATLANIPVLPARLNNRFDVTASFDYEIDDLTGQLMDDTLPEPVFDQSTSSSTVEVDDIVRAMKFNASALYTPTWFKPLSVEPTLGLGLYEGLVYVDFGLKTKLNFGNIIILQAAAERRDLIWYQHAGLILNVRLLEIEANVGMSSASFLSSYTASGLYAMIGIRIGI